MLDYRSVALLSMTFKVFDRSKCVENSPVAQSVSIDHNRGGNQTVNDVHTGCFFSDMWQATSLEIHQPKIVGDVLPTGGMMGKQRFKPHMC